MSLIYENETFKIRSAIFEVYKHIGSGFLESVYQECLEREFENKGISFVAQKELKICYKGEELKQKYIPDFICYDKIIVEIKAVNELSDIHQAQLFNYLKASKMGLGMLVNFGSHPKVEIKRIVNFT